MVRLKMIVSSTRQNAYDLTTFQIILLYAYRWQIELLFRFLKRTMSGIHLIRHDEKGVTIQFYAMIITALLELYLKQQILDHQESSDSDDPDRADNSAPESATTDRQPSAQSDRLHGIEFATWLNQKVKKYWNSMIKFLTLDFFDSLIINKLVGLLSISHLYTFSSPSHVTH